MEPVLATKELEELGYYSVDGHVYFHKYEALERATKAGKPVLFHYNEIVWDRQDWTKEPKSTLKALYKKRAQQLRDKYDYIILCYSGGADSDNILQTFYDAGLFIDEIVSYHDKSLSGSEDSPTSAEIFKVAIPRVKWYQKKFPKTVHNIVDIKSPLIQTFGNFDVDQLLQSFLQSRLTIGSTMRGGSWVFNEPRYYSLSEDGHKVCLLWGVDKPMLQEIHGQYAFRFSDDFTKRNRKGSLNKDLAVTDEFFYWSGDLPELLIKQCHVIKNKLETLPNNFVDPHTIDVHKGTQVTSVYSKQHQRVSIQTINTWLYGWDNTTFSVGKPDGNFAISQLDLWVKKYLNEDVVKKWEKARDFGKTIYQRYWETTVKNSLTRNALLSTKPYFLE